jgi:hypothetical protein
MEHGTLIQHLELTMICEESSTNVDGNRVILNVYPMMKREKKKVEKPISNTSKSREECQYCKKTNHQEKKCFQNPNNLENKQGIIVNEMVAQQIRQTIG